MPASKAGGVVWPLLFALLNGSGWSQMRPVDPVRTVIAAFDRVNLVGLGERHWAREDSDFRLRLIREPEFSRQVNDIVIEWGNPLYQTVLDRFVNGDDVPYAELSKVWQMTTQRGSGVWDSPIYEALISTVRSVNAGLPSGRRLRVVAGDLQIDYSVLPIKYRGTDRDIAAADAIRKEVLDKNHKALVVFGSFHFFNRPGNIVDQLKQDSRAKWFLVIPISGPGLPSTLTTHKATPSKPVIVMADGIFGDLDSHDLGWEDTPKKFTVRQLMDASLYFGNAKPELVRPVASPR